MRSLVEAQLNSRRPELRYSDPGGPDYTVDIFVRAALRPRRNVPFVLRSLPYSSANLRTTSIGVGVGRGEHRPSQLPVPFFCVAGNYAATAVEVEHAEQPIDPDGVTFARFGRHSLLPKPGHVPQHTVVQVYDGVDPVIATRRVLPVQPLDSTKYLHHGYLGAYLHSRLATCAPQASSAAFFSSSVIVHLIDADDAGTGAAWPRMASTTCNGTPSFCIPVAPCCAGRE